MRLPGDLAEREEDRVQAHDRPAVSGYASLMSARRPSAAGVAPASTNRPRMATAASRGGRWRAAPAAWLTTGPAASDRATAQDAVEDDRRPAEMREALTPEARPAKNTTRAIPRPRLIWSGSKPPISS